MAAEKNNKTLNVPNLRFPEFDGEWERCKVKDFTKVVAGATPSTSNKEYWGGDIRWMNSGELNLKRVYEVQGRITQLGYEKTSTKIIPLQSVLIGLAGQGKTRGTAAINYVELCTNQSIASILPSDKYYPEFLYQNIESRYKELRDISSGDGGRGGLNLQMIYNLTIPYCSLSEQKKIGKFLCLLDQRIETQKKVIEKYESLIRGIYHSVFSKPSSILQLREVVSVVKGKQVNGEELLKEGEYYVMNGGTEPSGYLNEYNTPANTISISEGGNSCGYVQYNIKPFWSGGHCYSLLQKDDGINYQYLYHFLKYMERDIMDLRIGSGLPNVQKKDLERFEIRVLPIEQQNRVAEILEEVSAKCDLEKRILQRWQYQKSFLLSNLFI